MQYLRRPERYYPGKELVIIDSGGYELSPDFDSTEPQQPPYSPDEQYNQEAYLQVLAELPDGFPIMITNYDHGAKGKDIEDQIQEAQQLFKGFPNYLHGFITRPSKGQTYLQIPDVAHRIERMRRFHVIGVTEKELGSSLLTRLKGIAELRYAMDRASVNAPIQVWGGLDPVITPLYFMAGAEIFDGVSWLRYGYYNDSSVSRDAYTALSLGVKTQWRLAQVMRLVNNIIYLEDLTIRMRRFVDEGGANFDIFGAHSDSLMEAYGVLCTEVPELRGGA